MIILVPAVLKSSTEMQRNKLMVWREIFTTWCQGSRSRHPCPCQNCSQWPSAENIEENLCWIICQVPPFHPPLPHTPSVKRLNWTVRICFSWVYLTFEVKHKTSYIQGHIFSASLKGFVRYRLSSALPRNTFSLKIWHLGSNREGHMPRVLLQDTWKVLCNSFYF